MSRLHRRFPAADDYKKSVVFDGVLVKFHPVVQAGLRRLPIRDIWIEQNNLIHRLAINLSHMAVIKDSLARQVRMPATIMQAVNDIARWASSADGSLLNRDVSDQDLQAGFLACPSILIIVPEDDIDPEIFKDAHALVEHTGVKIALPNICIDLLDPDYHELENADIVFASLNEMMRLLAKGLITLKSLKRIIVDEPFYLDEEAFKDVATLFRHPTMSQHVATAWVGRTFPMHTYNSMCDVVLNMLPYYYMDPEWSVCAAELDNQNDSFGW
jgi:hypothetical protein